MKSDAVATEPRFSLMPLMFQNFSCTLASMAFVALVGPIASSSLATGLAYRCGHDAGGLYLGILCPLVGWSGRPLRPRRIMLAGLIGFTVSYFLLCLLLICRWNGW